MSLSQLLFEVISIGDSAYSGSALLIKRGNSGIFDVFEEHINVISCQAIMHLG